MTSKFVDVAQVFCHFIYYTNSLAPCNCPIASQEIRFRADKFLNISRGTFCMKLELVFLVCLLVNVSACKKRISEESDIQSANSVDDRADALLVENVATWNFPNFYQDSAVAAENLSLLQKKLAIIERVADPKLEPWRARAKNYLEAYSALGKCRQELPTKGIMDTRNPPGGPEYEFDKPQLEYINSNTNDFTSEIFRQLSLGMSIRGPSDSKSSVIQIESLLNDLHHQVLSQSEDMENKMREMLASPPLIDSAVAKINGDR
jgi:hypothetical protein